MMTSSVGKRRCPDMREDGFLTECIVQMPSIRLETILLVRQLLHRRELSALIRQRVVP